MTGHRTSATQVSLFCSGLINHSAYLRRTSTQKGGPSALHSEPDSKTTKCLRTCSGGTDASLFVKNHVDLEVEHGLLDTACEYISSKADHLLRPCERVDDVVHLQPQAYIIEHGELIEPRVCYESGHVSFIFSLHSIPFHYVPPP